MSDVCCLLSSSATPGLQANNNPHPGFSIPLGLDSSISVFPAPQRNDSRPEGIVGQVDIYNEENEDNCSDVDRLNSARSSNLSEQVDSTFQQIMASLSAVAADSGLTSDISIRQLSSSTPADMRDSGSGSEGNYPGGIGAGDGTDQESVQTEDIEAEFRKTMVQHRLSDASICSRLSIPAQSALRNLALRHNVRHPATSAPSQNNTDHPTTVATHAAAAAAAAENRKLFVDEDVAVAVRRSPTRRRSRRSDRSPTKRVASVPVTSFDRFLVDSDADTVTSRDVRRQFRAAIERNSTSGHRSFDGPDDVTVYDEFDDENNYNNGNNNNNNNNNDADDGEDDDDVITLEIDDELSSVDRSETDASLDTDRTPVDTTSKRTRPGSWQWAESESDTPTRRSPAPKTKTVSCQNSLDSRRSSQLAVPSGPTRQVIQSLNEDYHQFSRFDGARQITTGSGGGSSSANRRTLQSAGYPPSIHRDSPPAAAAAATTQAGMDRLRRMAGSDHGSARVESLAAAIDQRVSGSLSAGSRLAVDNKVDLEMSFRLQQELTNLQTHIKKSVQAKEGLQKELLRMTDGILERKREIKSTEKQMKETMKKAENGRSELMLIEFKQQSMRQELEQLSSTINQRRFQLQQLESSGKKLQELGFTTDEVTRLIAECEELKERIKQVDSVEKERTDYGQQLTATRELLANERKENQQKFAELKQELDARTSRMNELAAVNESLENKMTQLDTRCKQLEKEKSEIVKTLTAIHGSHTETICEQLLETSQELSNCKQQMDEQISGCRENAAKELNAVKQSLKEVTETLANTRRELNKSETHNTELGEQLKHLQDELMRQSEMRDVLITENMKSLKAVINEKETALSTCKTQATEERKREVETLLKEKQQTIRQLELKYTEQTTELQSQLAARDLELQAARDRATQQETWTKQLTERIKEEAYQRFQTLLVEEKSKWEKEKETETSLQLLTVRDEADRTVRLLRDEVNHEKMAAQNSQRQVDSLRTELEDARQLIQQSGRDKQQLVSQIREAMEQDKEQQMAMLRDKLEQEAQRALEKLREAIRRQDDELERMRNERKELEVREVENGRAMEKYEQSLLNEIQQEHQRLAQSLNKSIKIVNISSAPWMTVGKTSPGQSSLRTTVASAIAGLRSLGDEMRQELLQLRQEVENQSQSTMKLERQHRTEIEELKEKFQKEKLDALESLKDRLIKTRSSVGLTGFFDVVDNQKIKEYRKKQMELERERLSAAVRDFDVTKTGRETACSSLASSTYGSPSRVRRSGASSPASTVTEVPPSGLAISHLRAKVERLEAENGSLRRCGKFSGSVPDLGPAAGSGGGGLVDDEEVTSLTRQLVSGVDARTVSKRLAALQPKHSSMAVTSTTGTPATPGLQQQQQQRQQEDSGGSSVERRQLALAVQRAENRAKLAEDKVTKNERLLSQKLIETSRLQGTLSQQNKELMQLQRAYTQLHSRCTSPTRVNPVRPSSVI